MPAHTEKPTRSNPSACSTKIKIAKAARNQRLFKNFSTAFNTFPLSTQECMLSLILSTTSLSSYLYLPFSFFSAFCLLIRRLFYLYFTKRFGDTVALIDGIRRHKFLHRFFHIFRFGIRFVAKLLQRRPKPRFV